MQSIKSIPYEVEFSSLKQNSIIKINGQTHIVYRENQSNNLYVQYNLPFETDVDQKATFKALTDIKKMSHTQILKVQSVLVEDRRLTCSSSSFRLFVDYHEKTLDEILRQKRVADFFGSENKFWKLMFSVFETLEKMDELKIDCNYIHPRSLYYNLASETFGIFHPIFFKENNFTEALAGNQHFCSPELYYQILSRNKKFLLVENDKSNSFSLGLIMIFIISSKVPLDLNEIYNSESISVNMSKIKELIRGFGHQKISALMCQVLMDMTSEFEHVRLSPKSFMAVFGVHRRSLESKGFVDQDKLLDEYSKFNNFSENNELNGKMSHAFGFDGHEDFNKSGHIDGEEIVRNLKGKAQPFSSKYLNEDNSF